MPLQERNKLSHGDFGPNDSLAESSTTNRVGEFILEKLVTIQCGLLSYANNSEDEKIRQLGSEASNLNIPPSSYAKGALEFVCWYIPTAFFNVKLSVDSVQYMFSEDKTAFGIAAALFHNFSYGMGLSAPFRAAWMTLYRKRSLTFGLCSMLPIWPALFIASKLPDPYPDIALSYGIDWFKRLPKNVYLQLKKLPGKSWSTLKNSPHRFVDSIHSTLYLDNEFVKKTSGAVPDIACAVYLTR